MVAGCLLGALLAMAGGASASEIQNTATVHYTLVRTPGQGPLNVTVPSNTVRMAVLPAPTEAVIEFLTQVSATIADLPEPGPESAGSATSPLPMGLGQVVPTAAGEFIRVDGAFCQDLSGTFAPAPPVIGVDGRPLDPNGFVTVVATSYSPGEAVIVSVEDGDRNLDPLVRDYVKVTVRTSHPNEAETLRMQETGEDTGRFAAALQSVPMPPDPVAHDCRLAIGSGGALQIEYLDDPNAPETQVQTTITVTPKPPSPSSVVLQLSQQASVAEASIGDFVQYTVTVSNPGGVPALDTRLVDVLPRGLRYRDGSARIVSRSGASGGTAGVPDEVEFTALASDGGSLAIGLGTIEPGVTVVVTLVAEVGSGTPPGQAVNDTVAVAAGLVSNRQQTVVAIREPLMVSHFTIVGRVLQGTCDGDPTDRAGVPGVRVLLDDGTYVATDDDGAYHFEGVRPGTHVVQLDVPTVPAGLEPVACADDTRRAGRSFSQFVEAQGGSLVRSDFVLQPAAPATGAVGARLRAEAIAGGTRYTAELDGGPVPASNLRAMLMLPEGARVVPGSATVDGVAVADPAVAANIVTFALGDPGATWRRTLQFHVRAAGECPAGGIEARLVALFDAGGQAVQKTAPATAMLPCGPPGPSVDSGRVESIVSAAAAGPAVSPFVEAEQSRRAILDDAAAAGGGDVDWLRDQAPGHEWLFPAADYNPRSPLTRAVVKHLPGETVQVRINGEAASQIAFDGVVVNAAKTVATSIWRGLPLRDGDNTLEAHISDADGNVVARLSRNVHFSGAPARAELVPEQSILAADGLHSPVIAVRFLDRTGRPVRAGMGGDYTLSPPYLPAQAVQMQQQRQLAGMESFEPTWHVEGDDGIAYIALQPTSVAGSALLGFRFQQGQGRQSRQADHQELEVWLKSTPRDWVVVGFAKGTVGYDTLDGNMEGLDAAGHEAGLTTDGQLSLYAKGRVLGKWMLTLAYDSDKPTDRLHRQGLLSEIDPDRFYTLYGDGTRQGYDAASADKVYLKLERDQFYALFGDFTTGLDDGELTRYHRTLNGLKVEYRGPLVEVNAFAAQTSQNLARDEIQGDGTSGLYRLSRGDIVMNGERVRIEVRDRYRSERIVETRTLVRHVDYDIDYAAGTLFFREPVPSRDFDFNPVFIVVEYETHGDGDTYLNGGGRVGVDLLEGRLRAGVTYLKEEDSTGQSQLAGIDARFRVSPATEVRAEVASSEGESGAVERSGDAYLVELEHHDERLDVLAYVRRQAPGFGLGQQNRSEGGMFKAGADLQWRITDRFSLQGQAWHQENLVNGATRDAMNVQGEFRADDWGMRAGLQWVRDQALDGRIAESRQVTLGANRSFLDRRLELTARADIGLDGRNDSVDFPTRLEVGAAYALTDTFRVLVAQEFTDGEDRDTSTTRFGFEAQPWAGARLTSTLNQAQISEYGPRTFGVLGLAQQFLVGERWSFDLAADTSHAFDESGAPSIVVNPAHPIAPGGIAHAGALTEDFLALSGGATYRSELWSWNGRLEHRDGELTDRRGLSTGFLRQAEDGVAVSAMARAFQVDNADGSRGLLANASVAVAWRPLGSRWSLLDRLEFRMDEVRHGNGDALVGQDTLAVTGDARSRRLVNNLVANYAPDPWTPADRRGNLFDVSQRSQLSLYYGSKYVFDTYGGEDQAGYTDIFGVEWRHDLSPKFDVGLRASVRHSWETHALSYAFGPSVGFSPFANTWFSLGYNIAGFTDRDFESTHYTARGPYLVMRFKFDQQTFGGGAQ